MRLAELSVLLLLPVAILARPLAEGDLTEDYTYWASKLHTDLLVNYVKAVPPRAVRASNYSAAGTDVTLQIRFFKVDSLSTTNGRLSIKVWWRCKWQDLRLSWDPAQYGNVTDVSFNAASQGVPEDSDIWLPDVQPYNAYVGISRAMEPAMARVRNDGQVYWSRPGMLDIMCRFSGLVMFPYDRLSCSVEVGGWINSGARQGLSFSLSDGCADFSTTEQSSLASYTEASIERVECSGHMYTYDSLPNEPFPVIRYRLFIKRQALSHFLSVILPSTLFTTLSFSVFFMSFEVRSKHPQSRPPRTPSHGAALAAPPARPLLPRSPMLLHACGLPPAGCRAGGRAPQCRRDASPHDRGLA